MTSAKQRIEITNARTQGNLKEDILDDKISLQKSITGKKRGKQKPRVRALDGGAVVETMRSMRCHFQGTGVLQINERKFDTEEMARHL